jgi:uncharacterized peroxidase-related enzyme
LSRVSIPARDDVPETSKSILDAVHKQFGAVLNMFRLIAQSPAALLGYTASDGALGKALDAKTRVRIALVVAQVNGCDYCSSAHTYLGLNLVNISPEEIALNRKGGSGDAKANAAVGLAVKIVREHGHITATRVKAVRDTGFTGGQIVVTVTAENIFTDILNVAADADIDFSGGPLHEAAW